MSPLFVYGGGALKSPAFALRDPVLQVALFTWVSGRYEALQLKHYEEHVIKLLVKMGKLCE